MICPVCGGTIEIDEGKDYGSCDTCMTYYFQGVINRDPEYSEDQDDAST